MLFVFSLFAASEVLTVMFEKVSELDEWNLRMEKCMAEGTAPEQQALTLEARAWLAEAFPE